MKEKKHSLNAYCAQNRTEHSQHKQHFVYRNENVQRMRRFTPKPRKRAHWSVWFRLSFPFFSLHSFVVFVFFSQYTLSVWCCCVFFHIYNICILTSRCPFVPDFCFVTLVYWANCLSLHFTRGNHILTQLCDFSRIGALIIRYHCSNFFCQFCISFYPYYAFIIISSIFCGFFFVYIHLECVHERIFSTTQRAHAVHFGLSTISWWNIKLVRFYRCNELYGVFILFSLLFTIKIYIVIFPSLCACCCCYNNKKKLHKHQTHQTNKKTTKISKRNTETHKNKCIEICIKKESTANS